MTDALTPPCVKPAAIFLDVNFLLTYVSPPLIISNLQCKDLNSFNAADLCFQSFDFLTTVKN